MGLIKTFVEPIAVLSMKYSFPSANNMTDSDLESAINANNQKSEKYQLLKEKRDNFNDWNNKYAGTEQAQNNPYVLSSEEQEFLNDFENEKADEYEQGAESGGNPENDVSRDFGKEFATKFETAVKNFLQGCIVKPIGGPASISKTMSIKNDLKDCGKSAFLKTFPKDTSDDKDIATKFGNEFANGCADAIDNCILTWAVLPAVPPATPVTPGGPVIAIPTINLIPAFKSALKNALDKTFPDGSNDPKNISNKFSTMLSTIAPIIGIYGLTCKCPPGGGNLIIS